MVCCVGDIADAGIDGSCTSTLSRRRESILLPWSRICSKFTRPGFGCIIRLHRMLLVNSGLSLRSCNRRISNKDSKPSNNKNPTSSARQEFPIPHSNTNTSAQLPTVPHRKANTCPSHKTQSSPPRKATTPLTNNNTSPHKGRTRRPPPPPLNSPPQDHLPRATGNGKRLHGVHENDKMVFGVIPRHSFFTTMDILYTRYS
jgi:hypothetical protein